jgi:hypothetical protein
MNADAHDAPMRFLAVNRPVILPGSASGKGDAPIRGVAPAITGPRPMLCADRNDWLAKHLRRFF